ncbi:MAG: prolyl oligopeptidase family serine peptidase [Thermoanaerobaculales bacterium]|nr:prolyl oligopeptidase family serine peptidase [Thermoanaerobaculales bacterium]
MRSCFLNSRFWFAVLFIVFGVGCAPKTEAPAVVEVGPPPVTRTENVVDEIHGVEVADPYRWLEDQEAPETRAWIEAQNAYTDSVLEQIPGRDELRRIIAGIVETDTVAIPIERGDRYFYARRQVGQDLAVIYRRDSLDGPEQVLVDPHGMSEDHTVTVGIGDASHDGSLLLYWVRSGGQDEVEYHIRRVDAGEDLKDVLPRARYSGAEFDATAAAVYFTRTGEEGPRVYRHELGQDQAQDEVLFGQEYGRDRIIYCRLSNDGEWLLAHVLEGSSGPIDLYLKNVAEDGPWRQVIADGLTRSSATVVDGNLVIKTDLDAPRGRVMLASVENPTVDHWRELVPEHDEAVLDSIQTVGHQVFVGYLQNVHSIGFVYDLEGRLVREVKLDTLGTLDESAGRWSSSEFFYNFSSFHMPPSIFKLDLETGEQQLWARQNVPIDSDAIQIEQVWYPSKDGTKIPMFLVHQRGVTLDGANPTLLEGYGGFNVNYTPAFRLRAASWVAAGGVYALANLRGGGEFGEEWHQAGMMKVKQNTFDDFIAASEWLIAENYTSPAHLGIRGGSNGGLLVGACMNQRPDLFGAVICEYPLLDMVRYHLHMMGPYWVAEYGSADDPELFPIIMGYSPYHNVADDTAHPATLFTTGDGDTRVAPLHARKMAALLQAKQAGETPILLRYHTKSGHSAGMPTDEITNQLLEVVSFLKWSLE